jgi:hypothetical protein
VDGRRRGRRFDKMAIFKERPYTSTPVGDCCKGTPAQEVGAPSDLHRVVLVTLSISRRGNGEGPPGQSGCVMVFILACIALDVTLRPAPGGDARCVRSVYVCECLRLLLVSTDAVCRRTSRANLPVYASCPSIRGGEYGRPNCVMVLKARLSTYTVCGGRRAATRIDGMLLSVEDCETLKTRVLVVESRPRWLPHRK